MINIILLLIFLINNFVLSTTYTVTNTSDAGVGSLRQAMLNAQTDPSPPSLIVFNIAGGVPQTITPLSTLPTIITTTQIDGTTQQPGWVPGDNMPIVINCSQLAIVTPVGFCFLLDSVSNCLIRGMAIRSYIGVGVNSNAIRILSTSAVSNNNQINNCFFGCDFDGTISILNSNTRSIVLKGNSNFAITNTIIGGTKNGDGNLLANSSVNAISIEFNVQNTVVQNNLFGVDKTGMVASGGNPYDIAIFGYDGVNLNVQCNNTIIRNNVLSNNSLTNAAAINLIENVNNTIIDNNKIGTNITGSSAIENAGFGINSIGTSSIIVITPDALGPTANILGLTILGVSGTKITNNIISANGQGGIVLNDLTSNSIIQGNNIGTDITGNIAFANSLGIMIQGDTSGPGMPCTNNLIGGTLISQRNIISGNTTDGIFLNNDVISTTIEGNLIGVNASSQNALPNDIGIDLLGNTNMPVTLTLIQNNTISGNTDEGMCIEANAVNNVVRANFIGTNSSQTLMLGNGSSGINIQGSATLPSTNNLIGGLNSADGNVIKFNGTITIPSYGVLIDGDPTTPDILNSILGNSIFLNNNNGIELLNNSNHLQEPPTITSATICSNGNQLKVSGIAPASPSASNFRIEFFLNSLNRNPITEGDKFVGNISTISTGMPFNIILSLASPLSTNTWLSATATNLNNIGGTSGDTSEFSLNFLIQILQSPFVNLSASSTTISTGQSVTLTATASGNGPFVIVWSDGFIQNTTNTALRIVSPVVSTYYTVTATDINGCISDPVTIFINVKPNFIKSLIVEKIIEKYC